MTQEEIDAYLATLRCGLFGNPIKFHYRMEDTVGGTLCLNGMTFARGTEIWCPFTYMKSGFRPTSVPQLRIETTHLLAEFAAHEILENFYEDEELVIDTHDGGVLCVTTGPVDLGFHLWARNPLSLIEFPAVAPQSG